MKFKQNFGLLRKRERSESILLKIIVDLCKIYWKELSVVHNNSVLPIGWIGVEYISYNIQVPRRLIGENHTISGITKHNIWFWSKMHLSIRFHFKLKNLTFLTTRLFKFFAPRFGSSKILSLMHAYKNPTWQVENQLIRTTGY